MNINNALRTGFAPQAADRAADAWRRITDKPTSITLKRGNTTLAAQTVRIEFDNITNDTSMGGAGMSSKRRVVVFGIKGHANLADTDIARGDLFAVSGRQYRVIDVIVSIGELQAMSESQV